MEKFILKIYTRKGDNGRTSIAGGKKIAKDSPLIEVVGEIDELNSILGVIVSKINCLIKDGKKSELNGLGELLKKIQGQLFFLGADIQSAYSQAVKIKSSFILDDNHVAFLEKNIDEITERLSPLKSFILPGGHEVAALIHLSRTVCRRLERSIVGLARISKIDMPGLSYINRLSDLLFQMARFVNTSMAEKENTVSWPK